MGEYVTRGVRQLIQVDRVCQLCKSLQSAAEDFLGSNPDFVDEEITKELRELLSHLETLADRLDRSTYKLMD